MDFANRNPQHPGMTAARPASEAESGQAKLKSKRPMPSKGWRVIMVILLFAATILLLAVIFLLAYGGTNESKYVNTKDLQAIDINIAGANPTNQIYFGRIKVINNSYFVMQDIYYFPATTSTSSTASTSLEPLVCQIDKPYDQMVINRSSVVWWENLQPGGKVASTITAYERDNPSGPTCPTSSTSTSTTK